MQPLLILADDNPAARSALALALESRLGLRASGEAAAFAELTALVSRLQPGLLVLDWELPGLDHAAGLPALRALAPRLRVLALSPRAEARAEALRAGADAFVCQADPPEALFAALRALSTRTGA